MKKVLLFFLALVILTLGYIAFPKVVSISPEKNWTLPPSTECNLFDNGHGFYCYRTAELAAFPFKSFCEEQGGTFKVDYAADTCGIPYEDAGKPCSDQSECLGACVANAETYARTKLGLSAVGECTAFGGSGYYRLIHQGVLDEGGIFVD